MIWYYLCLFLVFVYVYDSLNAMTNFVLPQKWRISSCTILCIFTVLWKNSHVRKDWYGERSSDIALLLLKGEEGRGERAF